MALGVTTCIAFGKQYNLGSFNIGDHNIFADSQDAKGDFGA